METPNLWILRDFKKRIHYWSMLSNPSLRGIIKISIKSYQQIVVDNQCILLKEPKLDLKGQTQELRMRLIFQITIEQTKVKKGILLSQLLNNKMIQNLIKLRDCKIQEPKTISSKKTYSKQQRIKRRILIPLEKV